MEPFVDFITRLIYGSGSEAVVTPNHRDWLSANPSPSGNEWITHYLDRLLPAYHNWLALHQLPPIVAWNGEVLSPWTPGADLPLAGTALDNPMSIPSISELGEAFRNRYFLITDQSIDRIEMQLAPKDPFSYRFWSFLQWCEDIRRRYLGEIVLPGQVVFDRDGTVLSPTPFCDVYNTLHANWHGVNNPTGQNSQLTPGFDSSAGQSTSLGGIGQGSGEEFIKFHHDHLDLFFRWLARTGQPPVSPINMHNGGQGWPAGGTVGNPSTWVEFDDSPWINTSTGDTDEELKAFTTLEDLGSTMNGGIHGPGHTRNTDITDINYNNYVPRFQAWHGWIDAQWYWRKPRFGYYDDVAKQRVKVFHPVSFSSGSPWPGMQALTIVRDPFASADAISPLDAVSGIDFTTGAGSLRIQLRVQDPYDRKLRMRLQAEVFQDATSTVIETIPDTSHTYLVGDTASGDDFDLNTDFTVDFSFASAFQSDDPSASNPSVGFVANRIRIRGTLAVADGSDPGFEEVDYLEIDLVQEKEGPEVEVFFDLASFGADQVAAAQAIGGGEGRFANAFYVTVQDRTSDANPIDWAAHPDVAPEMRGLIEGFAPAAGLFDDSMDRLHLETGDLTPGTPLQGVRFELASGPIKEDPSLPINMPQRYTYAYDVVFEATNNAFTGLATGDAQSVSLAIQTTDRSGNMGATSGQLRFFNEANPFMTDGTTSWLSIDTRAFNVREGETILGETLSSSTDPNAFITNILNNLNTDTGLGGDSFDGLPTSGERATLIPFDSLTDQSTGTSQQVRNFAIAKVRLQGNAGAADVRAFFRLFRYTASNLVFDPATHYRTHDTGSGTKVPLLGYEATTAGANLVSIPFFAEARVGFGDAMTSQTDIPNVKSFPSGFNTEQVLYFGVYLDVQDSSRRFPREFIPAHPDGGFTASDPTQPLPSLMLDAHQCMVVEIQYDGDPTQVGATPGNSDNLAQRNLNFLTTDNPGAPITHTVEHSFEVDLGKQLTQDWKWQAETHLPDLKRGLTDATIPHLNFLNQGRFDQLVKDKAMGLAMNTPGVKMMEWPKFVDQVKEELGTRWPLVFNGSRWTGTSRYVDELMIRWNEVPTESSATLYLPGINCEQVFNLRSLRHAPGDVSLVDSHTLRLQPGGVTFLPLPPLKTPRQAGVLTIELPEGIKKGMGWQVEVIHLRGARKQVMGGFQVDIQVKVAKEIYAMERLRLQRAFDQLSLLEPEQRWFPIMQRRVDTLRARAKALAESAGQDWSDPTLVPNSDGSLSDQPYQGRKLRVVLEKIQVLDDLDTWVKGKGELVFQTKVHSADNGGQIQERRFPEKGEYKLSDRPGENVIKFEEAVLFEGYVASDLQVEIVGMEKDRLDPDDVLGKYTRIFCGTSDRFFDGYGPDKEVVEPEDLISWKVWYRIERA